MAKKTTNSEKKVAEVKLIISPRVTEKASVQSSANAYTFVVQKKATKFSVAKEIEKEYKVKPIRVNITNLPGKTKFSRGKWGTRSGTKKAIVFLKKGDTIKLA